MNHTLIDYSLIATIYYPFVAKIDRKISQDEIISALPFAFQKLETIWRIEGDDNGNRRSFDYVAQIIVETVYAQRMQAATLGVESYIKGVEQCQSATIAENISAWGNLS